MTGLCLIIFHFLMYDMISKPSVEVSWPREQGVADGSCDGQLWNCVWKLVISRDTLLRLHFAIW